MMVKVAEAAWVNCDAFWSERVSMRVCKRIQLLWEDITRLKVDAIVNAANSSLLGGAGVDGDIHWAAGSRLTDECRHLGGCPTGEARITGGYKLPARYVIHTVGPVYGLDPEPERLLAACYRNCLQLAVDHGIRTIAFPAISCGAYRFPVQKACRIALDTITDFLTQDQTIDKVYLVVYSAEHYEIYSACLETLRKDFA